MTHQEVHDEDGNEQDEEHEEEEREAREVEALAFGRVHERRGEDGAEVELAHHHHERPDRAQARRPEAQRRLQVLDHLLHEPNRAEQTYTASNVMRVVFLCFENTAQYSTEPLYSSIIT